MNKQIIQAFIILIIILLGVSLISESNDRINTNNSIKEFEENISNSEEVNNGNIYDVNIIEEDSSNLISDINSKVANMVVSGLNGVLNFGLKLIEGMTN